MLTFAETRTPASGAAVHRRPKPASASSAGASETASGHAFERIAVHAASPMRPQAKLTVGAPGDAYEREADAVADRVMRMPEGRLQRACASCGGKDDDEKTVRRASARGGDLAGAEAPAVVGDVVRSGGRPLDTETRAFMEPRFGHDFSRVRVHTDAPAAESARSVGARAYTVGSHVAFSAGEYAPGTDAGRRLLAHELTHVVQQGK